MRSRAAQWVMLPCAAAASCGGEPVGGRAPVRAEAVVAEQDSAVIAEVDGRAVYADCVARQAAAHRLDTRAALDECIDFELLARAAEKAGWATDPEVLEVRRRETVRALIRRDFGPSFNGPEDIPDAEVKQVWASPQLRSRYQHPEYRFVYFVRAEVPIYKANTPEDRAAKQVIEQVSRAFRGRQNLDKEQFWDLAEEAAGDYPLRVRRGEAPYDLPRHGKADNDFAEAAFAIPQVGMVSAPTRTRWGWDVILLVRISPERNVGFEQAEGEIRQLLWNLKPRESCQGPNCDTAHQRAFARWAGAISNQHDVRVDPTADDALASIGGP